MEFALGIVPPKIQRLRPDSQPFYLVMHHSRAHGEFAAGGAQVAVVALERFVQYFALKVVKNGRKGSLVVTDECRIACAARLQRRRQVVRVDASVGGGEAGMLDAIFQFPHVAGPVVAHEHVDGGGAQAQDSLAVLEVHLLDKMVGEQQYVGFALGEVRQVYLENVQAVV